MSVSSDEVNFLVYRYLQESGFQHSAFSFGLESHINQSNINGSVVPPGALVSIIQKGIQFVEAEVHVSEDGVQEEESSDVEPLTLIDAVMPDILITKNASLNKNSVKQERDVKIDISGSNDHNNYTNSNNCYTNSDGVETNGVSLDVNCSKPVVLRGHGSEVFVCSWNPTANILASGSGDATARLWNLNDTGDINSIVLNHNSKEIIDESKANDVTSLDWNSEGSVLATGSYDGQTRIWTVEGHEMAVLREHKGPIFSIKWNKKGNYLLTAGMEKTCIMCESNDWAVKQTFSFHQAPTLDVDWQNNNSFASCSTDKYIHICKLGIEKPIKSFQGHTNEVNAIRWDPSGSILASCSDDMSAKIWSLKQDACLHDFQGHTKEIYTIEWSPSGAGSNNPNAPLLLASASFDTTVRLWDVEHGTCINTLSKHSERVFSVSFSPDSKYIATGSVDKCVNIWSTHTGNLLSTCYTGGGIFEVRWSPRGDKIAACLSDNTLVVLDVRTL